MKKHLLIFFFLLGISKLTVAAPIFSSYALEITTAGDTLYCAPQLRSVYCYPPMVFKNKRQEKFYWKTVRDVKKTLPYSKIVGRTLNKANSDLDTIFDPKERKKYLNRLEKEVKRKYEPVVRGMTISQGKMLVKLIDRETDMTAYDLIALYRGKISANFWQFIAKIFRGNLKDEYNGSDKDQIIERVINLVESGQL
ncbi:MAG: DUF4294 domain-containing protein [Paludibacteraceae bacterium]|jgi:hypothetical protein|nr:DUF4294 domain-containing protein [Paludibacteraceae bacterium]MBQ5779080.1 DUF4294 domain-containing protein [Paludibacteraceae bacterium]